MKSQSYRSGIFCLLLPLQLFFCFRSNGQVQMAEQYHWELVGELKTLGTTIAKLEYRVTDTDSVFVLLMKDFTKQRETNYFSISFRSEGNAAGVFKNLLLSFFEKSNKGNAGYMQTFRLGNTGVNLQHCTLIGSRGVRLTTSEGYINLSERQVHKLFGK
jgi:hypothetical protein